MAEDAPLSAPWGDRELEDGRDRQARIGPLRLRMRRRRDEVWLSHSRSEEPQSRKDRTSRNQAQARDPGPGNGDEWERWAVPGEARGLRLSPSFPDRPLVARPENAFHLVRGASVRVYVRVPLRVSVRIPAPTDVTLTEIATRVLSDTWFGDSMDGELMYFLPTTARRELREEHFAPHLAVCPLQLSNASTDDLEVEKIALRLAHLSIFARGGELWADETRVRYRGAEEGSEIEMSGEAPAEAPDAGRITVPRVPETRGFRARTFARLAGLPGFHTSF